MPASKAAARFYNSQPYAKREESSKSLMTLAHRVAGVPKTDRHSSFLPTPARLIPSPGTCPFDIQETRYGFLAECSSSYICVPLQPTSEERILDLCNKVVSLPNDSNEFEPTIRELKTAIHEKLEEARSKVAALARYVAARDRSDAAD